MKFVKIISISLLVLLCSNICFASTGIVNTPAVRIREKASTDSKIITKAYEDDELEILGEEGDWYKVKFDGKEGYASKNLIKEKASSLSKNETNTNNTSNISATNTNANNTNTISTNTVATNTSTENNNAVSNNENSSQTTPSSDNNTINGDTVVRVMPNFASNELRLLTKDTKVEVLRELNNWCEVSLDGITGWILKNKVDGLTVATVSEPEQKPTTEPEENTVLAENTVSENTTNTQNTVSNENNNTVENTTSTNTSANTNTTNTTTNTTASNSTSADNSRSGKGKINVETANVRSKASKSSAILDCLDIGDEVTIVAEEGDWYKITSSKVESGYVLKTLITISDVSNRSAVREEPKSEPEVEETAITAISKGTDVVNFAKQYLGCSYVLGGKTPDSGFDCSGYTRYVFKNFGYSLGTVAADQNSLGREVDRNDLQEGDLILFYNEQKTKIGHTGIYIGNNEFIHAANPDRGVVTDNLKTNGYYNERFVTARRIVE